ncbi:MAG: HPr(Ser) kinase/phosphatase [Gemmatimonadetes bacterium]|nr:HPr(Ser) kinase/phosphatase [Gemmatimonadota bacterium]MYF17151.1 HPr(Ser) kinase/phosphatase [Gemmatimonadota bacterium]
MPQISIGKMLEDYSDQLSLSSVAGQEGIGNTLSTSDVHRPGLALAGFLGLFTFDRVQVMGNTEMLYLASLDPDVCRQTLETIFQFDIPCMVITDGNEVLPVMVELSNARHIPLLTTPFATTKFAHLFSYYLDDVFAPRTAIHGSLVDVYGIGLLFVGASGIGKSEIAVDLVERGHRLVADDVVLVSRKLQGIVVGSSGETLRDHIEIRGLGILNVRNMFGVRAVRMQKRIEVVVKLIKWDETAAYDRIGLDEDWVSILDLEVPQVTVPIYPGKNITVIAETIALNYQLKIQGYHTAQEFNRRLVERMKNKIRDDMSIRADIE